MSPTKRSLTELTGMKQRGEKITVVTAYDAPSARLADAADMDMILVGDSAAMAVLGHDSTVPITVDEMIMLTRAVARATRRALDHGGYAVWLVPRSRTRLPSRTPSDW